MPKLIISLKSENVKLNGLGFDVVWQDSDFEYLNNFKNLSPFETMSARLQDDKQGRLVIGAYAGQDKEIEFNGDFVEFEFAFTGDAKDVEIFCENIFGFDKEGRAAANIEVHIRDYLVPEGMVDIYFKWVE